MKKILGENADLFWIIPMVLIGTAIMLGVATYFVIVAVRGY